MSENKRIMAKNEGKLSTSQMDLIKPKNPFHAIVPLRHHVSDGTRRRDILLV
jgi:hypothetical protein